MMQTQQTTLLHQARVLTCVYCQKSFGRTEHLKRHLEVHTKPKVFSCARCSKEFNRRDALRRHELIHQSDAPTLLRTGGRACLNCRDSKSRCSGSEDCERCVHRRLKCTYPRHVSTAANRNSSGTQSQQFVSERTGNGSVETPDQHNQVRGILQMNSDAFRNSHGNAIADPSTTEFEPAFWNPELISAINWLDPDLRDFDDFRLSLSNVDDRQAYTPGFNAAQEQTRFANAPMQPLADNLSTSPGLSMVSPQSNQSQTNSYSCDDGLPEPGKYYVDGEAARLPRVKRRRMVSQSINRVLSPVTAAFSLRFPTSTSEQVLQNGLITVETYSQILESYESTCLRCAGYTSFEIAEFPTMSSFAHLMDMYLNNFNTIIPIFHAPSFSQHKSHWILCLAMLAIGSQFLEDEQSEVFARSMHEFTSRAISVAERSNNLASIDELNRMQISMLHAVLESYSEGTPSKQKRLRFLQDILLSEGLDIAYLSSGVAENLTTKEEIELEWKKWAQAECLRRTWYSAWLLDCMFVFHFGDRAMLTLEDAAFPLPCHESLWTASTSSEWYTLQSTYPPTPTLLNALQKIYIEKHVQPQLGEFSRQLLIHGLFRRSWETEAYFRQRLSHWEPTATKSQTQDENNTLPKPPIWLPSVPTFTKWRNSACDCIDILHWDANAKIGSASGLEHPTVLHLHASRIILLTPFREITRLATFLSSSSSASTASQRTQATTDRALIRRWASQDQYKARLAAIHAGVLFWHVRRHSANAFYEPHSVFLATLALWAFSAFSPLPATMGKTTETAARRTTTEGNDGNVVPASDGVVAAVNGNEAPISPDRIILLDRPTDDELVQEFVRRGSSMWAFMSGVGNLYGRGGDKNGPAGRVLNLGKGLLDTLTCWTVAREKGRVLEGLLRYWISKGVGGEGEDVVLQDEGG